MMKILRLLLLVFPLLILAACGSDADQQPAQAATPTLIPIPTTPNVPARSVSFTTEDHVKLAGQLYGQGKTMIICSHMKGTSLAVWRDSGIPQRLAAQGYQVLIYDFRGNGGSAGEADTTMLDVDLNAAVKFAQQQGATKYVLMGASMGGTASLNVAVKGEAAALISVSAPQSLGVNVTDADLKEMKVPKLFIASEDDEPYVTDAKHMHEIAHAPKEIALYPGTDHGTEIFSGNNGDAPAQGILHFLAQYAPAS